MVPKPKGDGKVEQKSLNKIVLKANPRHASDDARPIFDGVGHSVDQSVERLEADNMQKQTQTYAEKVPQGGTRAQTRPTLRLGLRGLGQVSPAQGQRSGNENGTVGTATNWARLEPLSPTQTCNEVRFCRLDQNVHSRHQENDAEHRVSGETAPRSRSTRSNRGRAQVRTGSAHSHGTRATDLSGRSPEDMKITVKGTPR